MNFSHAKNPSTFEFHISRKARDRYQFEEALFSLHGNVIFANMHAVRLFSNKINQTRDLVNFPEQAVRSGQIYAMGLIDEILHYVAQVYREEFNPDAFRTALTWLEAEIGKTAVDATLRQFADEFPPVAVYRREIDLETYLAGSTAGVSHREILLEELLLLWLANSNPAFSPYLELFSDEPLEKNTSYIQMINSLREFFETQPEFGPDHQFLVEMLESPAIAVPHSLAGQLEYIRKKWGYLLGKYIYRLLSSLDLIREEEKAIFGGAGPARVYEFGELGVEPERFSPDKEWMPSVVIIAKNIYVWLNQLSKKFERPIKRLDEIPDEELDTLQRWGITGLWMIGLWERSQASQRIKNLMGNPDAVASAYSLYDYQIAADLGGEEAYENLRARAWERRIRLASDMVPNHMGIDSRWVVEHPDWFVALNYSPFPSYSFNGEDLSPDDRVGIYLEDHYYERSDAAVVFKRRDHHTGQESFIYHGNDGTSMPWNDTAQLNFLIPEVREAVIQTILQVARMFPIIRFDAAMTLAKKHFQRLWFPEPGSGGAIPSRAEFGLTKAAFDEKIPVEFWREVVDRVAAEVPDTLLLAEAFWLMEGYFVRTLGMHRVYNSAFMNMLRDEENANYRSVMKNTLEFDPEILKRFVNFMNNPDERTAIEQFGKDDKYFGVCTLMSTLPGLPMLGHGQIEGYAEKYGMEFRQAYWDEQPDPYLVARHEREIFPLLHRRYLFAGVDNFLLYDFYTPGGYVNEDVYAYSNRVGEQRALVVYHNKFAETQGWVRSSVGFTVKHGAGEDRALVQRTLAEGLAIRAEPGLFTIFREQQTGLEFIRSNSELAAQGLYFELGAYKASVFLDFREVADDAWHQYAHLAAYLNGRGVPNIEEASREIFLQPIHGPMRELINPGMFRWIIDNRISATQDEINIEVIDQFQEKAEHLFASVFKFNNLTGDPGQLALDLRERLKRAYANDGLQKTETIRGARVGPPGKGFLPAPLGADPGRWGVFLGWLSTHALGKSAGEADYASLSRSWIDEWLIGKILASTLEGLEQDEERSWRQVNLIKVLITHQDWHQKPPEGSSAAYSVFETLLRDFDSHQFMGVNRYQGILWINQELLLELLDWLYLIAEIAIGADLKSTPDEQDAMVRKIRKILEKIISVAEETGYRIDLMMDLMRE